MHVIACATGATEATGNQRMDNDRISNGYIAHRRANGFYPARVLMAQRVRQLHTRFFRPLSLDDVQVGAAETGAANAHDDIKGGCNLWLSDLFDHRRLFILMQTYRFHMLSPSG